MLGIERVFREAHRAGQCRWGCPACAGENGDKYNYLMSRGRYTEAADVAGLQYCDICGRSEIHNIVDIVDGKAELLKMTRYEEWAGLVVCEDCPKPDEGEA